MNFTPGTRLSFQDAVNPPHFWTVQGTEGRSLVMEDDDGQLHSESQRLVEDSLDRGNDMGWNIEKPLSDWRIQIKFSENSGLGALADDGTVWDSFHAFSSTVASQALSAPEQGGYNKTHFAITWLPTGEVYEGRLDIKHPSASNADNDLLRHVLRACSYFMRNAERLSGKDPAARADQLAEISVWHERFSAVGTPPLVPEASTGRPPAYPHPFEITLYPTADAKEPTVGVRFGDSMEECLALAKEVNRKYYPGAHGYLIRPAGQEATARVRGVLRDGLVFSKHFYFHNQYPQGVPVTAVTELELYE